MPVVETGLLFPTVFVLNDEDDEYEKTSPEIRLSLYVTDAVVERSYTRFTPVVVTTNERREIVAVLVAVVLGV
jgi:hypothetical protein